MKQKRKYTKPHIDPITGLRTTKSGKQCLEPGKLSDPIKDHQKKILRVVELASVDTPIELISKNVQATTQEVKKILTEYSHIFPQLEKLESLRKNKRDLVESSMFKVLESLTESSKINEASLKESAYAFDVLHKATRLESNQSTSNAAHLTFTSDMKSLDEL